MVSRCICIVKKTAKKVWLETLSIGRNLAVELPPCFIIHQIGIALALGSCYRHPAGVEAWLPHVWSFLQCSGTWTASRLRPRRSLGSCLLCWWSAGEHDAFLLWSFSSQCFAFALVLVFFDLRAARACQNRQAKSFNVWCLHDICWPALEMERKQEVSSMTNWTKSDKWLKMQNANFSRNIKKHR